MVQLPSGEIARVLASSLPVELRQEAQFNAAAAVEGTAPLGTDFQSVPSTFQQQQPPQHQLAQQQQTTVMGDGSGQVAVAGGSSISASDLLAAAGGSLTSGSFIEIDGQLYQIQDGNQ